MKRHRHYKRQLFLVTAASALCACTNTQVKEGAGWATGQLLTTTLDAAIDGGKGETPEFEPGLAIRCDIACEYREEARLDADNAERQRRVRRAEARALKAEFDAFMTER